MGNLHKLRCYCGAQPRKRKKFVSKPKERQKTIGRYISDVVIRAIETDDGSLRRFIDLKNTYRTTTRSKSAIFIRCNLDVVKRIREGAKERHVQMKMFVLGALRH